MLMKIRDSILIAGLFIAVGLFFTYGKTDASTFKGNTEHAQPWSVQATLLAADTSKTLKAAPGTGLRLVVTTLSCTILTSAAQTVDVGDISSTNLALRIPVSVAAGVQYQVNLEEGLSLVTNEQLRLIPAAAGPSVHCVAEGFTRGFGN